MALKTILVHIHDPRRVGRLLEAVLPLASAGAAHVIGLGVIPPFVEIPETAGSTGAFSTAEHRHRYLRHLDDMRQQFSAATVGATFTSEWREVDAEFGTVATSVVREGRGADLIVCSQADWRWTYSRLEEHPDELAVASGRPLLVVPNDGAIAMPPRHAVVAWSGTCEAIRAAFDLIELMPAATRVTVLTIDDGSGFTASDEAPGAELCAVLARHGLDCSAALVPALDRDVGRVILSEAAARGADVVALGAYGHSRLREFLLGGVSRHVLEASDIPLLMSH